MKVTSKSRQSHVKVTSNSLQNHVKITSKSRQSHVKVTSKSSQSHITVTPYCFVKLLMDFSNLDFFFQILGPAQGGEPQPGPAQGVQPVQPAVRQRANTAPLPVRPRQHEMIPFSNEGARRHCFYCLRGLPTTGFKAEKNKLPKSTKQCQSCEKCLCPRHQNLICTPCSNSFQPKNQQQQREGRL